MNHSAILTVLSADPPGVGNLLAAMCVAVTDYYRVGQKKLAVHLFACQRI